MAWTPEPRDATPQQRRQSPESECATLSASHDDSDSADSHSQDVGEVEGEEEHPVQETEESCDDGNAEQASDGQEAENNDVTRADVVNLQHSDFGNVEQPSERPSMLPARTRLQHIRSDNDNEIVLSPKSHPQQDQRGGGPAPTDSVAEPHMHCDDNPCLSPKLILKRRRVLRVSSDEEPD